MSSDPIEVLRERLRDYAEGLAAPVTLHAEDVAELTALIRDALASLSAPKPESAEAVIPWVREWKGSGPQRGFHIREATRLHNNRVVAYLGDQVDGDEVDKLIAEHNGKHPNGDPVRPAPPRPEASDGNEGFKSWVVEQMPAGTVIGNPEWWAGRLARAYELNAPQQASAPDYGDCCDSPAYCSSVRRCTAKDVPPSAPVGVEEVWLFKGSNGVWHTFHSEKHRLDTIADGGWDVRKFIAQQPAAVDGAMVGLLAEAEKHIETLHSIVGGEARHIVWKLIVRIRAALAGQQQGGTSE